MFSTTGSSIFRSLLLTEALTTFPPAIYVLLNPDYILNKLVTSPAEITPLSRTLTQWFSCVFIGTASPQASL